VVKHLYNYRNRDKEADNDYEREYQYLFQPGRKSCVGNLSVIDVSHVSHMQLWSVVDSKVARNDLDC